MICSTAASIAIVLIFMNLYVTLSIDNNNTSYDFYATLSYEQMVLYKSIVAERAAIYVKGLGISIIIGIVVAILMQDNIPNMPTWCKLSIVVATALVVNVMFYLMYPKSDSIERYLHTEQQKKAWDKCYRAYALSFVTGAILGGITAGILSTKICNCLLYTSPSPRDATLSRMPSSA